MYGVCTGVGFIVGVGLIVGVGSISVGIGSVGVGSILSVTSNVTHVLSVVILDAPKFVIITNLYLPASSLVIENSSSFSLVWPISSSVSLYHLQV